MPMMRSLAREMASHGIRVNGIAPGLIRTRIATRRHGARRMRRPGCCA